MTYTVTNLITDAYSISGVVGRDFQTATGSQITVGLRLLNDALAIKSVDLQKIPYFTKYAFTAIPGQEVYFIPGLVATETLTFNISSVRYAMNSVPRKQYQGQSRANNVTSLPFSYNIERAFIDGITGSNVSLYFPPASDYEMTLWGKFALAQVILGQDMDAILDKYYTVYLKYITAKYICNDYDISLSPSNADELKELEGYVTNIGAPDLTLQKSSCFSSNGGLDYAQVNIGRGWTPS